MSRKMRAIGGYFGLELNEANEYHCNAKRLNTGRNALEYILRTKAFEKIYLPYFTCDAVLEPIKKLNLSFEFYTINENLEPEFDCSVVGEKEAFVYTNYFGLKSDFIKVFAEHCRNLIVDNAQAFFAKPVAGIDTFYSPRKFFGIPDGAYLFTNKDYEGDVEQDVSYQRFTHLLTRIDKTAEEGYSTFTKVEKSLENTPIKKMSRLTQKLLNTFDYDGIAAQRKINFNYLHNALESKNHLNISAVNDHVPLVYPLLLGKQSLRKKLINNKIYSPQYWPNVLDWANEHSWEYKLTQNLVCLPIDQRYGREEMDEILNYLEI